MRIRIDFAEAFETLDYSTEVWGQANDYNLLTEMGKELESVLIEDYFNGADKAALYLGFSIDNEYFEYEIMSNT